MVICYNCAVGVGSMLYTPTIVKSLFVSLLTYRMVHLLQLMSHPFIKKYEEQQVDLAGFVQSVFDPTERLKDLSDVSR